MNLKSSLNLGKIFNIDIKVHWSFFVLILWLFISAINHGDSFEQAIHKVLFIFSIFLCVVLHELGHALTAKKFNCPTKQIILLPIGGMAQMKKIPEKPQEEFLVAIAGPIVSFMIAAFLYFVLHLTQTIDLSQNNIDFSEMLEGNFVLKLMIINFVLAIFNLIPAFPMDGGRILRSILSIWLDRTGATKIAANFGQIIAIIFMIIGFKSNLFLAFIGIFIFMAAHSEDTIETTKSILHNYLVRDIMMTKYTTLESHDNLDKVLKIILDSQEKEFVVLKNNQIVGVLTQGDIIRSLAQKQNLEIGKIMSKKFTTLHENTNLQEAYENLLQNQCSIAPIIKNSKLVAILNMENIQEFLLFKNAIK